MIPVIIKVIDRRYLNRAITSFNKSVRIRHEEDRYDEALYLASFHLNPLGMEQFDRCINELVMRRKFLEIIIDDEEGEEAPTVIGVSEKYKNVQQPVCYNTTPNNCYCRRFFKKGLCLHMFYLREYYDLPAFDSDLFLRFRYLKNMAAYDVQDGEETSYDIPENEPENSDVYVSDELGNQSEAPIRPQDRYLQVMEVTRDICDIAPKYEPARFKTILQTLKEVANLVRTNGIDETVLNYLKNPSSYKLVPSEIQLLDNTGQQVPTNTPEEANYNTNHDTEYNSHQEAADNTTQETQYNFDQLPINSTFQPTEYNFTNSQSGLGNDQVQDVWDPPDTEDETTSPACPPIRRSLIPDTVRLSNPPTSTSLLQENFSQQLVAAQVPDTHSLVPDTQVSVVDTQFSVSGTQFSVADNQFSVADTQFSVADTQFSVGDTQFSVADTQFPVGNIQFSVEDTQFPVGDIQFSGADTQFSVADTLFSVSDTQFSAANTQLSGANTQDTISMADNSSSEADTQFSMSNINVHRTENSLLPGQHDVQGTLPNLQQAGASSHVSSDWFAQQKRSTRHIPKPVFSSASQSSSLSATNFKQPANPSSATSSHYQPFPANQQPPTTPTRNITTNTGSYITRPATNSRTPSTRPGTPSSRTPVKQSWPRSPFPHTPGVTSSSKRTVVSTMSAPHQRGKKMVIYPADLVDTFKAGSSANTANNKETGALLAGSFNKERNAWIVTHLIYPKQIGTATYYTEIPGNNYWTYFIQNNLIQLGSIYTHPNFNSFMSFVDLHMHAGIQRYENSAVAFVYSPLHETVPIFSITDLGL